MGYSIVKYDEDKGWVAAEKRKSYRTFDEALDKCLTMQYRSENERYDVSYTPSKRRNRR